MLVARVCFCLICVHLLVAQPYLGDTAHAHPAAAIQVDDEGQVYFAHTGSSVWKIDQDGNLHEFDGPGWHFMALDPDGFFVGRSWPRFLESQRRGVVSRGDAEIRAVGREPTLILASSFPVAMGRDGALYYPEPDTDENLHLMRLTPGTDSTRFASIPVVEEIAPDFKPWKALWIHGLTSGPGGSFYYTEKEAVRKIAPNGVVSTLADSIEVPGCTGHERGGPILRGLDVSAEGSVYVAAMACAAVLRVRADGAIDVVHTSEASWAPTGVALSKNEIYVLEYWFENPEEYDSWLPRVVKLTQDGEVTVLVNFKDDTR